jgi:hypothetical protein
LNSAAISDNLATEHPGANSRVGEGTASCSKFVYIENRDFDFPIVRESRS